MEQLKLTKPVMINGKKTGEVPYDLERLTGADVQQAMKELQQRGIQISMVELDVNYHAAIFACAAGLALEDVARFGIKDYNKAVTTVRDFFLASSEEPSAQSSSAG